MRLPGKDNLDCLFTRRDPMTLTRRITKMKNKLLKVFLILCLGAFMSATVFGQESSEDTLKKLDELEKQAQKPLDMWQIENLMTLMAQQNKLGLKPGDVDYQETTAQKTKGVCFGVDNKYLYGDAARKALAGQGDPGMLRTGPSNMHMVTTGHIQVSGDGKTAKGIWYSPGFLNETGSDGKNKAAFDYKRYGVDFVKEDGEWKIWHFIAFTDWITLPNVSWTEKSSVSNTTIKYQTLTDTKGAESKVKAPRPFKTFSETFSYCPEEGSTK
jgi:hypothetical protein